MLRTSAYQEFLGLLSALGGILLIGVSVKMVCHINFDTDPKGVIPWFFSIIMTVIIVTLYVVSWEIPKLIFLSQALASHPKSDYDLGALSSLLQTLHDMSWSSLITSATLYAISKNIWLFIILFILLFLFIAPGRQTKITVGWIAKIKGTIDDITGG